MINKFLNHIILLQLTLDLLLLNFSLYLAPTLVLGFNELCPPSIYLYQVIFLNALWVLVAHFKKLYGNFLFTESTIVISNLNKCCLIFLMFAGFFFFILSLDDYSKSCTFISFVLLSLIFIGLAQIERVFILGLRKKYRNRIIPQCNVVLLGKQDVIEKISNFIMQNALAYNIIGRFSWSNSGSINYPKSKSNNGNFQDLLSFISLNDVQEIYCDCDNSSQAQVHTLFKESDRKMIRLRFLCEYSKLINRNAKISNAFGDMSLIAFRSEPLQDELNQFLKRGFDIIFSILIITLVLSWLTPILALFIKIDSKGPVFFKQLRSGKNNKPFVCYKFRSMHTNDFANIQQATLDDVRLTHIGRFLRRTSLDELPQFFNVLKNDMSVIGPRPHMIAHTEKYKALLDSYMVRHFLKPGITGWAQVSGYRGETKLLSEMKNRIQHDVYYLESWSFYLDLKIVFLTIWVLLKGDKNTY